MFTYSERPNTPAAALAGKVEPKVRFKRNEILRGVGLRKKRGFYALHIGKTVMVLTESDLESGMRFGFTDNYVRVALPANETNANEIVAAEVTGLQDDKCTAKIVKGKVAA